MACLRNHKGRFFGHRIAQWTPPPPILGQWTLGTQFLLGRFSEDQALSSDLFFQFLYKFLPSFYLQWVRLAEQPLMICRWQKPKELVTVGFGSREGSKWAYEYQHSKMSWILITCNDMRMSMCIKSTILLSSPASQIRALLVAWSCISPADFS